jgi:amino acid transporter
MLAAESLRLDHQLLGLTQPFVKIELDPSCFDAPKRPLAWLARGLEKGERTVAAASSLSPDVQLASLLLYEPDRLGSGLNAHVTNGTNGIDNAAAAVRQSAQLPTQEAMVDIHDETPAEAARDEADLATFGYKQELRRTLGVYSSFAVAFSYISPSTGIFTLFALGLATVGGVFIWSWPIVAIGQFIIALGFAELSSHYPVAGSVFQWTKYLSGKTYSWFAGWIYLFAGVLTVTAVCVTLPLALIPAFELMGWNIHNTLHNQRIMAIITLALITVLNIFGVRLVAIVNNTGVFFEILGMVVFAFVLGVFHHHQSAAVIFHTGGTNLAFGTFMVAMFMSLFVIYGFDTAGTLAEETRNPRREAPKAILGSVIGAFLIGGVFLFCMLLGIRDLPAAIKGGFGPAQIIESNFGSAFSAAFLMVVSAAIFVCCLAIETSTIRLCFGMSRDRQLPGSKALAWVHPRLHTPIASCLAIGVLSFIPMLQYAGAGIIAIAATGMIYLSYFIGNAALLRARLRGWPRARAPFSLGRWGVPLSLLGLAYGIGMLVNFAWPRVQSNPTPKQTGLLLNFHWNWLDNRPILWSVAVFITGVGVIYYLLVQRTKPAHLTAPEGEALAGEAEVAAAPLT